MKSKKRSFGRIMLRCLAVLLIITALLQVFTAVVMRMMFGRGDYADPRTDAYYRYDPDWKDIHPREEVQFTSGDNTLHGFIYGMENDDPCGLLVFAHGIGAGHESYIDQLMWFVEKGWRVFTYDATGSGESEGSGTVGLVQSALDLDKALSYAETDERFAGLDVYLLGHSWGGYAVSAVQGLGHDIRASVSISGYNDPVEMLDEGAVQTFRTKAALVLHPFIWVCNKAVYGEYADLTAIDGINKSGIPNLLIHGENDDFVTYGKVSQIAHRSSITSQNVQYLTLTGEYADHNKFFNSDECNEYKKTFNERKKEIMENYKGKERDDKLAEMVSEMDREKVNTINTDLLETINEFYKNA